MKAIVVLFAVIALAKVSSAQLTVHQFETKVDHFRPQDNRFVNFTYTLNSEFYNTNGPIYVFVNDGSSIGTEYIESGLMYDQARELNGALAMAKHRFNAGNYPTEDSSFENLALLTVDQALGDLASLIIALKRDLNNSNGRVIVFGVGYGASLATFARKKFPHLVDAVFASSPLFRAEAIDTTYFNSLSYIIRERGGNDCADRLRAAFVVLQILMDTNQTEFLEERMNLCTPIRGDNNQETAALVYRIANLISRFIRQNNVPGIQRLCYDMSAHYQDPFSSLLRWIEYAYGAGLTGCVATYDVIINNLNQTSWDVLDESDEINRAQFYLQCTQVGGLRVTTDFELSFFPFGMLTEEFQYQFCEDVFGEQYNRHALEGAVASLNSLFGGQDQVITNVAFSNAGLDPLLHHGIADYDVFESVVVFLENYSAGSDLKSISGMDSDNLATAKRTIESYVRRWATGSW